MILSDPAIERAVLSILYHNNDSVYTEISDILTDSSFTIGSNKLIFSCIRYILEKDQTSLIDIPNIYSSAKDLGYDTILSREEEVQHLKAIIDFPVNKENIIPFSTKLKKLEIARKLNSELEEARNKIMRVSGDETISSILSIAEDSILNFSASLDDTNNNPTHVHDGLEDYIQELIDNPIKQVGISTGFPVYDSCIGGGLRKSTINVIAARPKTGKTLLADNMGFYIANKLKIPVLNMDTEMTKEDHINRLLAMITELEISKIETGKFTDSTLSQNKIKQAISDLKSTPLFYKPIAGKPFDEQLSIMKRWLVKEVGLNSDGTAKPCVIFYDYLKLMDTTGINQDLKEYQVLGFMMTSLHNFACKYKLPIVAFVQLNRDGITKETTDTASGSDRIIWLCSNFTIFKRKSDEEIAEDGSKNGNRKLIPVISRHGPGIEENDYINCHMKGWCAKINEGRTRIEIANSGDSLSNVDADDDENTENKISF